MFAMGSWWFGSELKVGTLCLAKQPTCHDGAARLPFFLPLVPRRADHGSNASRRRARESYSAVCLAVELLARSVVRRGVTSCQQSVPGQGEEEH